LTLRLSAAVMDDFFQVEKASIFDLCLVGKNIDKFGKHTLSFIEMMHNLCQIRWRNMCKLAGSCSVAEVERRGDRRFCPS